MTPDFEANMQQHCHIIYLIYAAFYSTSVTWSTWTICSLELQKHREITQILLLSQGKKLSSNCYYWYSGFQVTAMIEWGKNKNPQKCLDQNLISIKSHAEFPSHKHSTESLIQKLKSLLKKHLNSLAHRKDIFCDDKSSRMMKGSREKLHSALCKDSSEADISVRRDPYACKFCPQFHKIIVTIEYGKLIKKWFPLVLVH